MPLIVMMGLTANQGWLTLEWSIKSWLSGDPWRPHFRER